MAKEQSKNRVSDLFSKRAQVYDSVFIRFLKWESILSDFFNRNNYMESGMKILDAGCGTGSVTKVLYNLSQSQRLEGIEIHAFDLSAAMLNALKEWINRADIDNIKLLKADVLKPEDSFTSNWNGYDIIVCSTMLEYIQPDLIPAAIKNLINLIKQNGRILFFITKRNFITKILAKRWWKANVYYPTEVIKFIQESGITNIEFKHLKAPWEHFIMVVEARKQRQT